MRVRLTAAVVMALARRIRYVETELLGLGGLVGPGSVCVDVGSAAGLYTVALARLAGPGRCTAWNRCRLPTQPGRGCSGRARPPTCGTTRWPSAPNRATA